MMDITDLQPLLPRMASPDWRLKKACADAQAGRLRLPAVTDEATRLLAKTLVELRAAPPDQLARTQRNLRCRQDATVLGWYADRSFGARLEARYLSRLPSLLIAQQLVVSQAAVDRYLAVCFDVASRLHDQAYILRAAIAPERRRGDRATAMRRTAMKFWAYHCGPQILIDLYDHRVDAKTCWRDAPTVLGRDDALQHLDVLAERCLGGAQPGEVPFRQALEAGLAAVTPFLSNDFEKDITKWWLRRSYRSSPWPAPAGDADPGVRAAGGQGAPQTSVAKARAKPPVDHDAPALAAVRRSFLDQLTVPASAPPGALDGPGIDPNWNVQVFDAPADISPWIHQQIDTVGPGVLVRSGLFANDDGRLQLRQKFQTPGSPIVLQRESRDGPLTGLFAGEWMTGDLEPISSFAADWETRRLAQDHGVVIATVNASETAAWRRLGIAAAPLPGQDDWERSARKFWEALANFASLPTRQEGGSANPPAPDPPPPPAPSPLPILIVSTLDPATMELRQDVDYHSAVKAVWRLWHRYCDDARVCIGGWTPTPEHVTSMKLAIVKGAPPNLQVRIDISLRKALTFLGPRQPPYQAAAADDLATHRHALATAMPDAPIESGEMLRQRYLRQFDAEVVTPLLDDASSQASATDRVVAVAAAGLMRRFGELDADLLQMAAGGDVDWRLRSAATRDACRIASEVRNLIKIAKGTADGRN